MGTSGIICDKLSSMEPYEPVENDCKIRLDANESFLEIPTRQREKIVACMARMQYNRYPDPLAGGACRAFGKRYGVAPECITAGNGSDELISLLFSVFTGRGDRVVITRPDFSMYSVYAGEFGHETTVVEKGEDLVLDPGKIIDEAGNESVRLVIFSNPCNPTGQGLLRDTVLEIVKNCRCLVAVDEAYMDFWDESVVCDAPNFRNLIVLKTCSKIGFAAGRLGFAVANKNITGYLRTAKSPYNINSMTQAAGEVFLSDGGFIDGSIKKIVRSRAVLSDGLVKLGGKYRGKIRVYGSHTNFITVKAQNAETLHSALCGRGISVRLIGDLLRITAGTEEENTAFLSAFDNILAGIG